MEQVKKRQSRLLTMFNEEELEACNILSNLDNFVDQPIRYPSPLFPDWSTKKRRLNNTRPRSSAWLCNHLSDPNIETKKVDTSSPNTPLSFSSGDSDHSPPHSSNPTEEERLLNHSNKLQLSELDLETCKQILLENKEETKTGILNYGGEAYVVAFPSESAPASSLVQPKEPRGIPAKTKSEPLNYSSAMPITREFSQQKRMERKIIINMKRFRREAYNKSC